jgi:hypothetical protein
LAARSLNKNIQTRNIRRVKINADVTFAIWVLESFGNMTLIIFWILARKNIIDLFLVAVQFWYYIVLPHTYLMNSSHNKDRIIDEGLKTAIRNAIGMPFNIKWYTNSLVENRREQDEKVSISIPNSGKKETTLASRTNSGSCENVGSDVYVISDRKCTSLQRKNPNRISINTSDENPSTSNIVCEIKNQGPIRLDPYSTAESEEESNCLPFHKSNRVSISKEIICYMIDNVNNEEHYLHYFLQLIQFEDDIKRKGPGHKSFNVVTVDEYTKLKAGKVTQPKMKPNHQLVLEQAMEMRPLEYLSPQLMLLRQNSVDILLDRIERRRILLQNFDEQCTNEEFYNKCINELIDFEENLIENKE